jgi:uncharacterized LabA/DUF88 family protein
MGNFKHLIGRKYAGGSQLKPTAILIDGGYLRQRARAAGKPHRDPDFIFSVAEGCIYPSNEEVHRVLYYDCKLYEGEQRRPISGDGVAYDGGDNDWLGKLAEENYFAVRLGHLTFRGWQLKREYLSNPTRPPTDYDFDPIFVQKGVDMRIGLDVALLAETKVVNRVFIMTADSDFIPAFKHGRKSGLQMGLIVLPGGSQPRSLYQYFDIVREIDWP